MNTAKTIKTARMQANLTRKQLAQHYNITLRTLEAWEGSERTPPEYVVAMLLRCLELDFPTGKPLSEKTELATKIGLEV